MACPCQPSPLSLVTPPTWCFLAVLPTSLRQLVSWKAPPPVVVLWGPLGLVFLLYSQFGVHQYLLLLQLPMASGMILWHGEGVKVPRAIPIPSSLAVTLWISGRTSPQLLVWWRKQGPQGVWLLPLITATVMLVVPVPSPTTAACPQPLPGSW